MKIYLVKLKYIKLFISRNNVHRLIHKATREVQWILASAINASKQSNKTSVKNKTKKMTYSKPSSKKLTLSSPNCSNSNANKLSSSLFIKFNPQFLRISLKTTFFNSLMRMWWLQAIRNLQTLMKMSSRKSLSFLYWPLPKPRLKFGRLKRSQCSLTSSKSSYKKSLRSVWWTATSVMTKCF